MTTPDGENALVIAARGWALLVQGLRDRGVIDDMPGLIEAASAALGAIDSARTQAIEDAYGPEAERLRAAISEIEAERDAAQELLAKDVHDTLEILRIAASTATSVADVGEAMGFVRSVRERDDARRERDEALARVRELVGKLLRPNREELLTRIERLRFGLTERGYPPVNSPETDALAAIDTLRDARDEARQQLAEAKMQGRADSIVANIARGVSRMQAENTIDWRSEILAIGNAHRQEHYDNCSCGWEAKARTFDAITTEYEDHFGEALYKGLHLDDMDEIIAEKFRACLELEQLTTEILRLTTDWQNRANDEILAPVKRAWRAAFRELSDIMKASVSE